MTNLKTIELIDRYLKNDLSKTELEEFRKILKKNPELQKEIQLHAEVNKALQEKDIIKFRLELEKLHEKQRKNYHRSKIITMFKQRQYAITAIAASVAVVLVVGGLLLFNSSEQQNSDNYFTSFYEPEEAVTIVRSGGNSDNMTLKNAMMEYQGRNYESAIELFSQKPENNLAKFYMGLSYLESGNTDKAIELFKSIINHQENLFVEQAQWYLGLSYLKVEKTDEAKKVFNTIINSDNIYKDDANKILKNLD